MSDHEYEAQLAEYNAKAGKLEAAERTLVEESHADEARRQALLAQYDRDLEAHNRSGIEAYIKATEEIRLRNIGRKSKLAAVRAEFDALKRPRPPGWGWARWLGR